MSYLKKRDEPWARRLDKRIDTEVAAARAIAESAASICSADIGVEQKCSELAKSFSECQRYLEAHLPDGVADRAVADLDAFAERLAAELHAKGTALRLHKRRSPAGAEYWPSSMRDLVIILDPNGTTDDDEDERDLDDVDDDELEKIAKAAKEVGQHSLAAALVQHLQERLTRRRDQHGYTTTTKRKDGATMRTTDSLENIVKDFGPIRLCKQIAESQHAPCDEASLVAILTEHVGGDRAFAKLFESEPDVQRACAVAKAGEFDALAPMVVVGPGAMADANDNTAQSEAYRQLVAMADKMRVASPVLSAEQAFARVFEDPANAKLAALVHRRPAPATVYAMPHLSKGAVAKSDPAPSADSAYAELMRKAEAYRAAHPELSIEQSFERVYGDRANVELAKRERIESAPR
jgi:hypothetical protein